MLKKKKKTQHICLIQMPKLVASFLTAYIPFQRAPLKKNKQTCEWFELNVLIMHF